MLKVQKSPAQANSKVPDKDLGARGVLEDCGAFGDVRSICPEAGKEPEQGSEASEAQTRICSSLCSLLPTYTLQTKPPHSC
ncbi:hypothetical protein STEG23_003941 [Scotinomys teguina]